MRPSILTTAGTYFSFKRDAVRHWDIDSIGRALSKLCRFNGHCDEFYSVAQHSYLASYIVPPQFAYEALLHDRTEYVLGDMTAPLKQLMPGGEHGHPEFWERLAGVVPARATIFPMTPKQAYACFMDRYAELRG